MELQKIIVSEADRKSVSVFMGEEYPIEIDFNWLMPVVEKISKGIALREFDFDYELFEESDESKLMHLRIFADITTVWQAVVSFIRWHNQNSITSKPNIKP